MKTTSILQLTKYILHFCTLGVMKHRSAEDTTMELKPHSVQRTRTAKEGVGRKESKGGRK